MGYIQPHKNPSTTTLILDAFFDVLSGIPSIVIGLFGFALSVFLHRHYSDSIGPCLLVSSIALSLLVLPYIIRTTQATLEGIPLDTRLTALALGATKLQNIFSVLIPKCLSGIMSGIILAIGRCAEDTYAGSVPVTELRKKVAMVFQTPNPLPMSIRRNIAFPLKLAGNGNRRIVDGRVEETLNMGNL